jgi:hypothetical protein
MLPNASEAYSFWTAYVVPLSLAIDQTPPPPERVLLVTFYEEDTLPSFLYKLFIFVV